MRINLREDETKNYMMLFQEFLERLQALNRKTMNVLNDEMRTSKYDKLQRTISNVIDAYMDVIVKTVQGNSFTAWEESEASLHACLDLYRAGEAAHAVCVLIEQQMKEQMEELLHIEKEAAVITDRPVVSEEGMEYIKDILQAALSESEELKNEFTGKADSRAEENDIYGTLKPLFQSISVSISAFLEESLKKFKELHEFVREASSKIRAAAEEESQRAASSGHVQAYSGAGKETGGQSGARKGAVNIAVGQNDAAAEDAGFKEESFDEANVKIFVVIIEKLVEQTGVEKLNDYIEKNYASLSKNIKSNTSKKAGEQKSKVYKSEKKQEQTAVMQKSQKAKKQEQTSEKKNIYGRYTVTPESIHLMEELCRQTDIERDKVNRFYGEKFRKREKGFTEASKIIHELSSFIEVWGSGKEEITKLFSADNSVKDILEAINKGMTLLKTAAGAGSVVKAGTMAVQFLDKMLPSIQKSAILVKASEKLWKLTRSNIQASYLQRLLDVYMMEHYELKYGIDNVQTGWFEYFHDIILKLKDESIRRHFENALFAAEMYLDPRNCTFRGDSWKQVREISCGIFLNLVRSGLTSKQDMKAADANKLTDQLYDIYLKREGNKARVELDPMGKMVSIH